MNTPTPKGRINDGATTNPPTGEGRLLRRDERRFSNRPGSKCARGGGHRKSDRSKGEMLGNNEFVLLRSQEERKNWRCTGWDWILSHLDIGDS